LWAEDQTLLTKDTVASAVANVGLRSRSCCWSAAVPAADAKKADDDDYYYYYLKVKTCDPLMDRRIWRDGWPDRQTDLLNRALA